jgi:hypothetical protein
MTVSTTYTLTFGLFRENQDPITEDEFFLFIDQEVTPLLKSFCIRDELGFWNTEPEPARVLTYVSNDFEDGIAIHAIAVAYKTRFKQQAVMINSFASFPDFV